FNRYSERQETDCLLESDGRFNTNTISTRQPAFDVFVFVRFERRQATRVRSVNSDCAIDAAGTSLHWLTGVSSSESVAYLSSLASQDSSRSFSGSATAAIAFHADPAADVALERLASTNQPRPTRQQAAFWIASRSSSQGIDFLRKLAREDKDEG